MPIEYERDDQRRLIRVTVTDPHSVDDTLGVLDRQAAEDTWEYAMLYDLRAMTHVPTEADGVRTAHRVRALGGGRERGPVGFILGAQRKPFLEIVLYYAKLTKKHVPVEALLTAAQVDDWLARNARRRTR